MFEGNNPADDEGVSDYTPDVTALWSREGMRAMLVVLTRRLGPDFAKEVHNEIFARMVAYEESCPDDQTDGKALERLLKAPVWDKLFTDA